MAIDESLLSNISPKKRSSAMSVRKRVPKAKTARVNPWDSIAESDAHRIEESVDIQRRSEIKKISGLKKTIKLKDVPKKKNVITEVSDPVKRPTKNFTQIPNSVLEFLYTSNISQNECKFLLLIIKETLGWGRDYCLLSKKDILEKSSVTNNLIYKVRESLSHNGIISYGKSKESTKNFYTINAKFFEISTNDEVKKNSSTSIEVENEKLLDFLKVNNKTKKSYEGELSSTLELIESGKDDQEVLLLMNDLILNGALDGSLCSRPASYLTSGAYDAVLNRTSGKSNKIFDGQKIFDLLSSVDTNGPMSDEIKNNLTQLELDWIEKRGGLRNLGKMNNDTLRFELKV